MKSLSSSAVKVGRPKLSEDEKKLRLSLTLSKHVLTIVDDVRGNTPRSSFIESVLHTQNLKSLENRDFVRKNGAVYTPPHLADFIAHKVVALLWEDQKGKNKTPLDKLKIIDPACGSGELLNAIWNRLRSQYVDFNNRNKIRFDPRDILCGIDIDQHALNGATYRLESLGISEGFNNKRPCKILNTNSLFPFNLKSSFNGWERIKNEFNAQKGFDVVIANPPWGADITNYRSELDNGEFTLFQGQSDTSDLFIELALKILRPGGFFSFIVPDSLFSHERRHLRKLLVEKTQIKFLARLGEKFFEDVHRACAVVICQKKDPLPQQNVECLRLTPDARKSIFDGKSDLAKEDKKLNHKIPQVRFLKNKNFSFDIDLNTTEEKTLAQMNDQGAKFDSYLVSTRGIELSKFGMICQCRKCFKWLPLPDNPKSICLHCGSILSNPQSRAISIVRKEPSKGAKPFIVGESVYRYSLKQKLWIFSNYDGINYKESTIYKPPKLLVRKTGVGISASIDYTNAFTNQVVYIFRQRPEFDSEKLPLEFFLGVLNSRAMYYFLMKRHGEIEWRSHPYVTQSQILNLPLPNSKVLNKFKNEINIVVKRLIPFTRRGVDPTVEVDSMVENLTSKIFGLTRKDYKAIYATLDSAQELLPIRRLKQVKLTDVFRNS